MRKKLGRADLHSGPRGRRGRKLHSMRERLGCADLHSGPRGRSGRGWGRGRRSMRKKLGRADLHSGPRGEEGEGRMPMIKQKRGNRLPVATNRLSAETRTPGQWKKGEGGGAARRA
eukprot:353054-Chlamydomonas_euryale.AAC.1